jgi:hypothetical protein
MKGVKGLQGEERERERARACVGGANSIIIHGSCPFYSFPLLPNLCFPLPVHIYIPLFLFFHLSMSGRFEDRWWFSIFVHTFSL